MGDRIVALVVISAFLLILDVYLYRAITAVYTDWKLKNGRKFTYVWWGYSIFLIMGVFIAMFFNLRLTVRAMILVAFFITFVSKVVFLPFLLLDDLRRRYIRLKRKWNQKTAEAKALPQPTGEPIKRSEFLLKTGIAVAAIPFSSLTWGIASGAYDYQVRKKKLILPNLPKEFEGMIIGQISDIHSGSFYNKRAVTGGVELLLGEKPDAIFFTGDIINNLAREMGDYQDIFSKVKAPLGVYSTLGNHDYGEYYFGKQPSPAKSKNLKDVIATHKNMGWDLLMNENRKLKVGGEEIAVIGIENWGAGRFPKYGKMDQAVAGTGDSPVKLLLSHDPSHWRAQVIPHYPQIDAMFSGHTHGMQFGVKTENFQWSPVQYLYEEWSGLYTEQHQQLYVNVGYGFLGYPGRVGILPEITIFELTRS